MKHIFAMTAFSFVSSLALANTPAAAPATAEAPAAKVDSATKVGMRVHLDPFYKNLNDSAKNYKTPKVDSLRLMFERQFGKYSKADVEVRLHELESRKEPWYTGKNNNNETLVNTNTLKYFHFLFDVPMVEGLELGYVREMEPALYGYTDRIKSTIVAESPSFTGHMGRLEGFRAAYELDPKSKLTYHLSRNADQTDYTLGSKPSETTWYHKLTANSKIDDTALELGLGVQGQWLDLGDSSKLKNDYFVHALAKHALKDLGLEIKGGVAYDSYAVEKLNEAKLEAAANTATTVLVGTKYDLLPKEFVLIGEVGVRQLKLASKKFIDFSSDTKPVVDSSTETSFVLAGQYFIDEKLSLTPSYSYFNSSRAHAYVNNNAGSALADRKVLVKGADRKASKDEQSLGLRVRYDY